MRNLILSPERERAEFSVPEAQIAEDLRDFYNAFRRTWAIARIDGTFPADGRKIVDAVADLPLVDLKPKRELSFPWQRDDALETELSGGLEGLSNYPIKLAVKSSVLAVTERHPEQAKSLADIKVTYTSQYPDKESVGAYLYVREHHPDAPRELPAAFFERPFEPHDVTIALHFDPLAQEQTTRNSPLQNHHVDRDRYVGMEYNFQGINPERRWGQPNTWLWAFQYPRIGRTHFLRGVRVEDSPEVV